MTRIKKSTFDYSNIFFSICPLPTFFSSLLFSSLHFVSFPLPPPPPNLVNRSTTAGLRNLNRRRDSLAIARKADTAGLPFCCSVCMLLKKDP
ncbi:hypothetical protein Ahy_A09g045562 isoform D [Arachis hypogaea]|uniref:Uncharacterized protein n=1 Tax=Arachis hypogaea TaxID=3818 RepID=A0A445BMQ7_ARAHY|nr:hypothetical protein Ahy_A09g045562 isoform D [Arachis hypogaea]